MTQAWLLPVTLLVGYAGVRTALRARRSNKKDHSWWMLLVMSELPLACWALSQVVRQR